MSPHRYPTDPPIDPSHQTSPTSHMVSENEPLSDGAQGTPNQEPSTNFFCSKNLIEPGIIGIKPGQDKRTFLSLFMF